MVDARRPIPRRAFIPLHVGIIDKQFAVRMKGQAIRIAKAAGNQLPTFSIPIRADDVSRRRLNSLIE